MQQKEMEKLFPHQATKWINLAKTDKNNSFKINLVNFWYSLHNCLLSTYSFQVTISVAEDTELNKND